MLFDPITVLCATRFCDAWTSQSARTRQTERKMIPLMIGSNWFMQHHFVRVIDVYLLGWSGWLGDTEKIENDDDKPRTRRYRENRN